MIDGHAICRANCDFLLRLALRREQQDPSQLEALQDVARGNRRLAILALLADADRGRFAMHLGKAAQAYTEMLGRPRGADTDPATFAVSKAEGFFDALACGALALARVIAQMAESHHHPEVEYEDDYLRYRTLMSLLIAETDVPNMLDRWTEVLEGGDDVFLPVVEALFLRDDHGFEVAFDALIHRRAEVLAEWRMLTSHDQDIDATEGKVFIEALGILRLAELRGLTTRRDYRFVPDIARIPLGQQLPADGAWRVA